MPIFEHDGIQFSYDAIGQGQPLVMCHGLTGNLSDIEDLLGEFPEYRLVCILGDSPIQSWHEVESLDVPALVLGNENDTVHPYSMAEAWATHLRHGRLECIPSKSIDLKLHTLDIRCHVRTFLKTVEPNVPKIAWQKK